MVSKNQMGGGGGGGRVCALETQHPFAVPWGCGCMAGAQGRMTFMYMGFENFTHFLPSFTGKKKDLKIFQIRYSRISWKSLLTLHMYDFVPHPPPKK